MVKKFLVSRREGLMEPTKFIDISSKEVKVLPGATSVMAKYKYDLNIDENCEAFNIMLQNEQDFENNINSVVMRFGRKCLQPEYLEKQLKKLEMFSEVQDQMGIEISHMSVMYKYVAVGIRGYTAIYESEEMELTRSTIDVVEV